MPRSRGRAIAATLVAAGLGLSTSLYPLPATFDFTEFFPPGRDEQVRPPSASSTFMTYQITNTATFRMSDLVTLTQVLEGRTLDIPTGALMELVNRYGLPDVVQSLEMLRSVRAAAQGYPREFQGSADGAVMVSPGAFPKLVTLLEYILEILPGYSGAQLAEIITSLLPAVVASLGRFVTPGATPMQARSVTVLGGEIAGLAAAQQLPPPARMAVPAAAPSVAPAPPVEIPPPTPTVEPTPPPVPEPVIPETHTLATVETTPPPSTTMPAPPSEQPSPSPEAEPTRDLAPESEAVESDSPEADDPEPSNSESAPAENNTSSESPSDSGDAGSADSDGGEPSNGE